MRDDPWAHDEVIAAEELGRRDLVIHRNAKGMIIEYHSPLKKKYVRCKLCETPGQRIYIRNRHEKTQ